MGVRDTVYIYIFTFHDDGRVVSPTAVSRKRKANDESSPYMSEADDDDGGPPNTDKYARALHTHRTAHARLLTLFSLREQ